MIFFSFPCGLSLREIKQGITKALFFGNVANSILVLSNSYKVRYIIYGMFFFLICLLYFFFYLSFNIIPCVTSNTPQKKGIKNVKSKKKTEGFASQQIVNSAGA